MGGMIAQELAIRFPERVRGLVLGGTSPGGPRAARPALRELGALGAGAAGGWTDGERRVARRVAVLGGVPARAARAGERAAAPLRPPPRPAAGRLVALVGVRLPRHDLAAEVHRGADAGHARRARRDGPDRQRAPAGASGSPTPSCASCPAPATPTCSSARRRRSSCCATGSTGARRSRPERRARAPPRAPSRSPARIGLPIGAARTGASLAGMTLDKLRRRDRHVAPDR